MFLLNIPILETPKRVLLQTVKSQMKCSIMLHFIQVYTVCKVKRSSDKRIQFKKKIKPDTPTYVKWTILSLLYQTRMKNPLVYKGLTLCIL